MKKEIQKEVKWLNIYFIKTSLIKKMFTEIIKKELPNRKNFGFYRKLNENENGTFSESEIEIIRNIKAIVINSIKKGELTYVYKNYYITNFLIPELKKLYSDGTFQNIQSINYNTVRCNYDRTNKPRNIILAKFFADISLKKKLSKLIQMDN